MHLVFDTLEPEEKVTVTAAFPEHQITFLDGPLTEVTVLPADTNVISVFVASKVTKAHIDSLPNLACIAARSMGVDHIDLAAAQARSIPVLSVSDYGTHTVAEFAFALLLTLSRKAVIASERMKTMGDVDARESEGIDLFGRTLGVAGTGKIGRNVARIGKAFGMQVLLYDVMQDAEFAKEIDAPYVPLDELVKKSDVLSIHIPLLPTTTHLFNAELFAQCKRGTILINTARGPVVDTIALKAALESGIISAAGLDVFEGEHEIFGHEKDAATRTPEAAAAHDILAMPNVIMTPHIAYNTKEAKAKILATTIENIRSSIVHA